MVAGNASQRLGPVITRRRRQDANAGRTCCAIVSYSKAAGSTICGRSDRVVPELGAAGWDDAAGSRVLTLDFPFRRDQSNLALVLPPRYLSDRFIRQTCQSLRLLCRSAVIISCSLF
jgi:hypothetical protein